MKSINNIKQEIGLLVVVTGAAGAGKDYVIDEFLKTETAQKLNLKKVKTNADRLRRPNEPEDAYYFISKEELDILDKNGELAEEIVYTGFSRKATSKSEIYKVFENQNLIWRVDPTLASKIAKGNYFETYFPNHAEILKRSTLIIHIHAPKETVEKRRKIRDKESHVPHEYLSRDNYEKPYLQTLFESSNVNVIKNPDGKIEKTIETISMLITNHYEKIKN